MPGVEQADRSEGAGSLPEIVETGVGRQEMLTAGMELCAAQPERLDGALKLRDGQLALPRVDAREPDEQVRIVAAGLRERVVRVRLDASGRLGVGPEQHAHQPEPPEASRHLVVRL